MDLTNKLTYDIFITKQKKGKEGLIMSPYDKWLAEAKPFRNYTSTGGVLWPKDIWDKSHRKRKVMRTIIIATVASLTIIGASIFLML